jgi:hypothetical protein
MRKSLRQAKADDLTSVQAIRETERTRKASGILATRSRLDCLQHVISQK